MGIPFSCLFAEDGDVESELESLLVKSISLGDGAKTPVRSVSFNGRASEPIIMKSLGPGKMTMETSVGLRESELQKMTMVKSASVEKEKTIVESEASKNKMINNNQCSSLESLVGMIQNMPILDLTNPKHHAALKLQKVYKSFRTRRKLADCAVLVEQSWWKLLDFAELKRSSISFFDIEKHETAISRWSRARTRAAKVGKGLSKNDKAQKLALQHWLEAIDPRHRYGHNLHFYYVKWLHCQSKEPFFYWLDIGEGKEVNMVEKCSRLKLQQQCIKYLGPMERLAYEVVVRDGKFVYKQSNEILHMSEEAKNSKWIFVLGTSKNLYVGKKQKGTFQHSSFLAGGATSAAGRLVVDNGTLKAVWPHSGHYRPTEENFKDFVLFLEEQNVDLTDVKMSPVEDGDELLNRQKSGKHLRSNSSDDDLVEKMIGQEDDEINGEEEISTGISDSPEKATAPLNVTQPSKSKRLHILARELSNLEIPKREELIERLERESQEAGKNSSASTSESPAEEASGIERAYWVPKQNLFDEEDEEKEAEVIPEESILKRINSHKGMKSLQLGKQLSCKWTTGAGPRIGCVRDYPAELQFRALEQVSLSPRSGSLSRSLCGFSSTRGQELGKKKPSKCLIFS